MTAENKCANSTPYICTYSFKCCGCRTFGYKPLPGIGGAVICSHSTIQRCGGCNQKYHLINLASHSRMTPTVYRLLKRSNFVAVHRTLSSCCTQRAWLHHGGSTSSTRADDNHEHFGSYRVILPEEPFVWGVAHIKPRLVPTTIARPLYAKNQNDAGKDIDANAQEPYEGDGRIKLNSIEETRLRDSAKLATKVLEYASGLVKPGATTNSIDEAIHEFILAHNAYPSPLLYAGFPRSCCTSVNNIVTHGIPDDRPLEDGDIVNVDVTVYRNGYHGDTSQTFLVGEVDETGRDLVNITNAALEAGISACGPGRPFQDIGLTIHKFIQKTPGYSVCTAFSGHGIGTVFHRPPWIYHTLNDEPGTMLPGHCFTIEPCIVEGSNPHVWVFPDGWTASTENCARSAQAEHMLLITESGVDVLTR